MKKLPSIWFCLAMDAIGMLSFSIPFLGEFSDVVWAPLSAIIFYMTFGGRKGAIGAMLNFAEEALPFLDFIPTFTIAWVMAKWSAKKDNTSTTDMKVVATV